MSSIDGPRLALYVVLGLGVCVLGARYLLTHGAAPAAGGGSPGAIGATAAGAGGRSQRDGVALERADGGRLTVHVAGAVRRGGVYRLAAGARVDDAVRRAGGVAPNADLGAVNLAAKLEDGRQVLVPQRPRAVAGAGGPAAALGAGAGAGVGVEDAPVNLNSATLEQLDTLDGVGPGIAQRIIEYREAHNGFARIEELGEVPGIGAKRLATLTPLVIV